MDQLYWNSGWVESAKEVWEPKVREIVLKEEWIIDGNYRSTMDIRIARADTIIFLDYSTVKCLYRVFKRILKYRGRERPDMPKGCKERFDLEFLHYVATFRFHSRNRILRKLEKEGVHEKVVVLRIDQEVRDYLSTI